MRPMLARFQNFRRRFKATRPFTLTGAGWVFILYTIGVGAGAINTGNNLLYLAFGVFLGLIIASGALSDMSLWSLEADVVWPRSADAGDTVMIPVRVTNRKRFLPSICVTLEVTGEIGGETLSGRAYLGYLPAGATQTMHAVIRPVRRGWFQARVVRFTTRYPFGLLHKRWISAESPAFSGDTDRSTGLFIYPPAVILDRGQVPAAAAGLRDAGAQAQRGEGDSIYGLREFRDDDTPRRIDWKASAKRSGDPARAWVVRETERERESEVALAWNAAALAAMSPDERHTAFRFGRSLVDAYAALGHRARFLVIGADGRRARVVPPLAWDGDPELEFLALWEPGGASIAAARYLLPATGADDHAPVIDVLAAFAAAGRSAA